MFHADGWLFVFRAGGDVRVGFQEYQVQFKFELVKGYWCSRFRLVFDVWWYILYYTYTIIYYYILYYTLLLFFPTSPDLFFTSPLIQSIRVGTSIYLFIFLPHLPLLTLPSSSPSIFPFPSFLLPPSSQSSSSHLLFFLISSSSPIFILYVSVLTYGYLCSGGIWVLS